MNSGVMLFLHFFVSPHVKWFNHRLPVQEMLSVLRLNCHWVHTQARKFLLGLLPQWQTAKTTAMLYLELPLQSAFLVWHHIVTSCCWQWDYAVWNNLKPGWPTSHTGNMWLIFGPRNEALSCCIIRRSITIDMVGWKSAERWWVLGVLLSKLSACLKHLPVFGVLLSKLSACLKHLPVLGVLLSKLSACLKHLPVLGVLLSKLSACLKHIPKKTAYLLLRMVSSLIVVVLGTECLHFHFTLLI